MKKLALSIIAILFAVTLILAQSPNQFNYQAVLRNADGTIIKNDSVILDISILQGSATGTSVFNETHNVITTSQGLINLNIGSVEDLSVVNWSSDTYFIQISVNETIMGTSQLLSVPYAMHAETVTNDQVEDADADSENELQNLTLNGTTLEITNGTSADLSSLQDGTGTDNQTLTLIDNSLSIEDGNSVDLIEFKDNTDSQTLLLTDNQISISDGNTITIDVSDADSDITNELQTLVYGDNLLTITDGNSVVLPSSLWTSEGNNLFFTNGNVGIGSNTPNSKLEVKGEVGSTDDLIFGVLNNNGDTVFAVYQGGVRIYVDDTEGKATGNRGGFAVGGFSSGKTVGQEYLTITPDSVRIYIDTLPSSKATGNRGGFAVGGFSSGKSIGHDFLKVTPDSVRIYIDTLSSSKATGNRGGFAVGGFSSGIVSTFDLLKVTADSTRVYVNSESSKATNTGGGFAVGGFSSGMTTINFLNLTPENYFIGHEAGLNTVPGTGSLGKYNSFLGYNSGKSNTSGYSNVFIGYRAGVNNQTGIHNVCIGNTSGGSFTSGDYNVFIGTNAGYGLSTTSYNTFIGINSGYGTKSGSSNTYLGVNSGYFFESGSGNTFIGADCGRGGPESIQTPYPNGSYNSMLGFQAGRSNTEGDFNVFLGSYCGNSITTGSNNTFVGYMSGGTTSVTNNVSFGYKAGYNSTGISNVFLGYESGYNTSGSSNVFIGNQAGYQASGSNLLYIHNSSSPSPLIYGEFNNSLLQINGILNINDILHITPRASEPSSPSNGDIYLNTDGTLHIYVNDMWKTILCE